MTFFKRIVFILPIAFFVFCYKEQSHQILPKQYTIPENEQTLIQRSNYLGFETFRYLINNSGQDCNLVISPLGMSISMSSLFQIAAPSIRQDIKRYMSISNVSDSSIRNGFDCLHGIFSEIDKNTVLQDADNFAFKKDLLFSGDFTGFIEKHKYLSITIDPNSGFIQENNEVDKDLYDRCFQIINSINFKARAKYQLKVEESPFYHNPDKSKFVDMIVSESMYNYYGDASIKAIEIPLGRGNFNMLIIMANGMQSLDELSLKLNMRLLNRIREKFQSQYVELFLPQLHISVMESYLPHFKQKRLNSLFQSESSGFSGINEKACFYLSDFEQVVDFEISFHANPELDISNEKVDFGKKQKNTLFIDHPFLFIIYEKYSDGILFIGKIVNP